jgi:hypothetical protein
MTRYLEEPWLCGSRTKQTPHSATIRLMPAAVCNERL